MRGRITRRGCHQGASKGPCAQKRPRDEKCLLSTPGAGGCGFQWFHQEWFHFKRSWSTRVRLCIPFWPCSLGDRNIKALKGRFIAQWRVWKKKECCWPVCSQVWARNVFLDSKTKQGRLRGWQVLGNLFFLAGTSFCCKRVNNVEHSLTSSPLALYHIYSQK